MSTSQTEIVKMTILKKLVWTFVLLTIMLVFLSDSSQALTIKYGYGGKFGRYGIADTASAYEGSTLIAEAVAIRIIEKDPGPNWIELEETHYSPSGSVIYRGKLFIRFGFGGGQIVQQSTISGRKIFNIFGGWPSGY